MAHSDLGTTSLFGIPITRNGFDRMMALARHRADSGQGGYVCFANVHTLTEAQSHSALRDALSSSTWSVADGLPLVWISKRQGDSQVESRVCGPDFMKELLTQNPEASHGFLGGKPGSGEALAQIFSLKNWAAHSPPFRPFNPHHAQEDWIALQTEAQRKGIPPLKYVWVGLGAPKQELWMKSVAQKAGPLFFGVGAAFDFLTGSQPRAPLLLQKMGMEWAFRLASEPRRLWKRYLTTNSRFVWMVLTSSQNQKS